MKINVYRDSELLGTFNSLEEAAYKVWVNPRNAQRNLNGRTRRTQEGYSFEPEGLVHVIGFSYPYYLTVEGEKVHQEDVYIDDKFGIMRKSKA